LESLTSSVLNVFLSSTGTNKTKNVKAVENTLRIAFNATMMSLKLNAISAVLIKFLHLWEIPVLIRFLIASQSQKIISSLIENMSAETVEMTVIGTIKLKNVLLALILTLYARHVSQITKELVLNAQVVL